MGISKCHLNFRYMGDIKRHFNCQCMGVSQRYSPPFMASRGHIFRKTQEKVVNVHLKRKDGLDSHYLYLMDIHAFMNMIYITHPLGFTVVDSEIGEQKVSFTGTF